MTTARHFEEGPDLWQVVDAAGLHPKGRARNFAFDCPDCGRKGKASGRRDGPWHCFACDAKGNARTLARRFELAEMRPVDPPTSTENRNGVAPSTARAAWSVLEGLRDAYAERLSAYLEDARGWPAELANAGARVSGWAWIPPDCPELPRPLAWTARDADRRAAFALRDERGDVWTLERRWTSTAPPVDPSTTPKALRLRTRSEEAGRLAIFGHLPDAVAAAARGEPVYLCEGGPDFLAAAALCRLDGRGAAIGSHGHSALPRVAAALRAGLERAAVPVSRVHVLCVPHLGDVGDVGERSMLEAADALAGVAAVSVIRVSVDAAGKGDFADAARAGVHNLRTLAAWAGLLYAPPIDVRDPDAHEAISVAMLRALKAADADALALVIMPPGVGKTTAAFERAAIAARQGHRVVFALPDHENAASKIAEFRAAFPDVHGVHAKGMPSLCELPARHPDKRAAIERAAATMGRRMCKGCPLARLRDGSGGTCEGWREPRARAGVVTFAAHAGIASLARTMEPADLVIVDELPGLIDRREIGPAHLESLRSGGLAARRWYKANPGHGDFARELATVAADLDAETPRGMYAERVEIGRVVDALRQRPAAVDAAAAVLAEVAADLMSDRPPMPTPADARRGAADRWPDAGAWTLARTLARAVCDPEQTLDPGCLRLDGDGGGWAFESARPFALPAGARILALDATGEIDRIQWEALAARHGRTLAPVIVTAIGEKPDGAEHYQTGRLCTGRLWARQGRRVSFMAAAPGAIRNALLRAAGAASCVIGVLTHKPLADALRWGVTLATDPDAAPPADAAFGSDDWHALEVAEIAAGLVSPERGWTLEIGHFGRDDRASNAFETVDVLAVLGAPRPDAGAVAEDARVLRVDPSRLIEARTKAATVQALARARHLRRSPAKRVRLFLASDCEAPTGPELPGVVWTVEAADSSHAPTLASIDAAAEIAAWAAREGCIDVAAVRAALTPAVMGWRVAERLCRLEAERRGWIGHRIGREGRKVYADVHGQKRSDSGSVHRSSRDGLPLEAPPGAGAPVAKIDVWWTVPKSLGNPPCTSSSPAPKSRSGDGPTVPPPFDPPEYGRTGAAVLDDVAEVDAVGGRSRARAAPPRPLRATG